MGTSNQGLNISEIQPALVQKFGSEGVALLRTILETNLPSSEEQGFAMQGSGSQTLYDHEYITTDRDRILINSNTEKTYEILFDRRSSNGGEFRILALGDSNRFSGDPTLALRAAFERGDSNNVLLTSIAYIDENKSLVTATPGDPIFNNMAEFIDGVLNASSHDNLATATVPSVNPASGTSSPVSPASSPATNQTTEVPVLPVPEAVGWEEPANTGPAVDPRPVAGSTATGEISFGDPLPPANSSAGQTQGQGAVAESSAPAAPSGPVVAGTQSLGGAVGRVTDAATNMAAISGMINTLRPPIEGFITDRFGIDQQAASNLINTAITQGIGGVTTAALQNPQILQSIEDSLNDVSGALELIRLNPEQVNGPWSGMLHSRVQKAVDGVPSELRSAANLIPSEQVDIMPSGVREVVAVVQLLDTIGELEQEELANIFTDNPELKLDLGEPRQLAKALVDDSLEFIQGMQDPDHETRSEVLKKWNGATRYKIGGLTRAIEAKEQALSQ